MTKIVILIGGPSKGTRFRPLSLERAKPLFPVAGHPLIWHHLKACTKVPNLQEVLLMGFYSLDKDWNDFIDQAQKEFGFKIRYLHEDARLGTMGGINKFRDEILQGNTEGLFFVLHCDIVCSFPLLELLQFHVSHGKECTILGHKVASEEAHKYGCLAVNESTNEVLHYAEKPETFVSDIINCGVYLFSSAIFTLIDNLPKKIQTIPHLHHDEDVPVDPKFLRLEQDVLMNICGDKHVYVYKTNDFWLQIKSAGMIIKCSEHLLTLVRRSNPEQLLKYTAPGPLVVGDVLIHPTAKIDPSSKLGPNVSIGANVKIGAGVRIRDAILLDDVLVKDHALINNSIVGWESKIGEWSRLEGSPDYENPEVKVGCGMTILGTGVKVAPEIIIRSSIVLPHKDLDRNHSNQILL